MSKKIFNSILLLSFFMSLAGISHAGQPPKTENSEYLCVHTRRFRYPDLIKSQLKGIENPATDIVIKKNPPKVRIPKGLRVTLPTPKRMWRGFFDAGQTKILGHERIEVDFVTEGASWPDTCKFYIQWYGGPFLALNESNSKVTKNTKGGYTLTHSITPDNKGKTLSAIFCEMTGSKANSWVEFQEYRIYQKPINTRIDADRILATPPKYDVRVEEVEGMAGVTIDGKPVTLMGWASMILHNVRDKEIKDMVDYAEMSVVRLPFALGESVQNGFYPATWLGPDHFDFGYVDKQVGRILKANPKAKIILLAVLDGTRWWTNMHPECSIDVERGIPDYLSPEWISDSRDLIRQLIAHVQSSDYGPSVIGYQLFNGSSMDCNFPQSDTTPRAIKSFRAFLAKKYKTVENLRKAWNEPNLTFENALPERLINKAHKSDPADRYALLIEPSKRPRFRDSFIFREHEFQQVIINFARDVKEATHGRALAGARTGDFMGHIWNWKAELPPNDTNPIRLLAESPYFDFFEVQEPYPGRLLGVLGSGVPMLPVTGLSMMNKIIVIENDVRTHLSKKTEGFGRTPDLKSTIAMQRRVMLNAMVKGMFPYLWQMSYKFNGPDMIADYRLQKEIFKRSLKTDRRSGAEVAFVFDLDYRRSFGYDPRRAAPSRGFSLFDYPKFAWTRAGVPYDMIFLNQLDKCKPYKVYVFVHTVEMDKKKMDMIRKVAFKNNAVSIFIWADGFVQNGKFDDKTMSDFIGIKIKHSRNLSSWQMKPSEWFEKDMAIAPDTPMGTLKIYDPCEADAAKRLFSPTFTVNDKNAKPIAYYLDNNKVGIALKKFDDYSVIYDGSGNVTPELLRYACKLADVHIYSSTLSHLVINNSFIMIHTMESGTVKLRLPIASGLYEVFRRKEYDNADEFQINLEGNKTYLFFRGTKAQWASLKAAEAE